MSMVILPYIEFYMETMVIQYCLFRNTADAIVKKNNSDRKNLDVNLGDNVALVLEGDSWN